MPLANCKECGKQVSTSAKACPSCGVPSPTKKEKNTETHFGVKKGSKEGNAIGIIIMVAFWGIVIFVILKTNSCSTGNLF